MFSTAFLPFYKRLALLLAIYLFVFFCVPLSALARTGGPVQPEFSKFEPVGMDGMVNTFSGDFTYSLPLLQVPGPHGSGYPVNLVYSSNITMEEEASWVGYGWMLNAGAITRNLRGIPDDYNGRNITYFNKAPKNWTLTAGGYAGIEAFGQDSNLGINSSLRYNSYVGFGFSKGIGVVLGNGLISLGYQVDNREGSYSVGVNPGKLLTTPNQKNSNEKTIRQSVSDFKNNNFKSVGIGNINLIGSNYGVITHNEIARPVQVSDYNSYSINITIGAQGNPLPLPIGSTVNVFGSYSSQENKPEITPQTYGYMYLENAPADGENAMMDYHTERNFPYDKRDRFLGAPFASPDQYVATGYGVGGGFQLHRNAIGQFYPRKVENKTVILNGGVEVSLGQNFGVGFDIGAGEHTLTESGWKEDLSAWNKEAPGQDVFFRFNNDMSDAWEHASGDDPLQATIVQEGKGYRPELVTEGLDPVMNQGKKPERSSFIHYKTNQEIYDAIKDGGNRYKARTLNATINRQASRSGAPAAALRDLIGEFALTNESGMTYVYGLPIYSSNESEIQYGANNISRNDIAHNFLVTTGAVTASATKRGQEMTEPYPNSHLLTEILSPGYVDRTLDGPTTDDLGGYTRFNYQKDGSYEWRIPYENNTFLYDPGSLSDLRDDLAAVSQGTRDLYFLHSIETKTHVALFNTGSRSDAKGSNNKSPKKLESIALYGIEAFKKANGQLQRDTNGSPLLKSASENGGRPVKPVKTVYLEYATAGDALMNGVPNAAYGKLTLKKVYTIYEGLEAYGDQPISPYEFHYEYPDFTKYPAKYRNGAADDVTGHLDNGLLAQNPPYSPFDMDAWGYYQYNGHLRYDEMENWVNQTPDASRFDPAAYLLKRITLPTGGEIHVQYEQDDYGYVQDKLAHAMVSLKPNATHSKYYLNTADLGLTTEHYPLLKRLLEQEYINGAAAKRKIYFKMLYALVGNNTGLFACNNDFITGYFSVKSIGTDANGIFIIPDDKDNYNLPQEVCRDFLYTQRAGRLSPSGNCDPSAVGIQDGTNFEGMVRQLIAAGGVISGSTDACMQFDPAHSYLRVPVPYAKKGGGVRVKRLMMYDKGLNRQAANRQPVLYGQEYIYNFFDDDLGIVRSSGVATNEPSAIREENILVDYLAKDTQTELSKIIAGVDREQYEGPIGESVYPGASVGYSRVAIRDIHSGASNTGFSVEEYYTAKDYPITYKATRIQEEKSYKQIPTGFFNKYKNNLWATQGYSIVMNDMHGQKKSMASYQGPFEDMLALKEATLIASTEYTYYEPGEAIPLSDRFGSKQVRLPGKDMEVAFGSRAIKDYKIDGNVETDATISIFGFIPFPFLTFFPTLTEAESEFYTHVTTKVVRYPAILKAVTSQQDGIEHIQEHLAFNAHNGRPVAVKSYDEFEGTYIRQDNPASWEYRDMGRITETEYNTITAENGLTISLEKGNSTDFLSFTSSSQTATSCAQLGRFATGDLLQLKAGANTWLYHVQELDYGSDRVMLTASMENTEPRADAEIEEIQVIRSGKTNQLETLAGQTVFHSTDKNFELPVLNPATEWAESNFTRALTQAYQGGSVGTIRPLVFTSGGTTVSQFSGIDLSYLGAAPRNTCTSYDPANATIRNVKYIKVEEAGEVTIRITEYEVVCGG